MAQVVVTPAAAEDLARLIASYSLPPDTKERFHRSLAPLSRFPLFGATLEGRWQGLRFLLGPWRWMIVVYVYDESADRVAILTVQDGRSSSSATASH